MLVCFVLALIIAANAGSAAQSGGAWKPVQGCLMTRWAAHVSPDTVWPEYPRPQMVRKQWGNLNGLWDYAIVPKEAPAPNSFEGKILVPFPAESALSGVGRAVRPDQRLWYRRSFSIPDAWRSGRVLLHFGAVDWHATVLVNGRTIGEHKGGYTPFTFDITEALRPSGPQELMVGVWDPTDTWTQPRGKQTLNPQGIWYTAVTGIWQTVWLEPVPATAIRHLMPVPDVDRSRLRLTVEIDGDAKGVTVRAEAIDGGKTVAATQGKPDEPLAIALKSPRLWTPESPHLYGLKVSLWRGARRLDEVQSYFAMRKVSLGKDAHGHTRILLNGRPCFHIGLLDQGWWPDGLYTAPTDEALRSDIELMRRLGFNAARKHVKVEPARWYYHCDRLGLLVWQDMPNGNLPAGAPNSLRVGWRDPDAAREAESAAQFEAELKSLIRHFSHFPSIILWVVFNEGWGQYETARLTTMVKQLDPSRLVTSASGWTDRGTGDVIDAHVYPGPGMEPPEKARASVVGEYGGLGLVVPGHLWMEQKSWGYQSLADQDSLEREYLRVTGALRGMIGLGLSAAIYTQMSDVETEVNGLVTYDRAVTKFRAEALAPLHASLMKESRKARIVLEDSSQRPQPWRYSFEQPAAGWERSDFEDSAWRQGLGGFGQNDLPRFRAGTPWESKQIWLRRTFANDAEAAALFMTLYQNVTYTEVYLNGQRIYEARNPRIQRRHYTHVDVSPYARLLKKGQNVLAIHAVKEQGPRAIDAGLYLLPPAGQ